jgi:hypothetical protein
LKRQKLVEEGEWLIWERSPSPVEEPLLQEQDTSADAQLTAAQRDKPVAQSPAEVALDQEELQIFWYAASWGILTSSSYTHAWPLTRATPVELQPSIVVAPARLGITILLRMTRFLAR